LSVKQVSANAEVDERLSALLTNVNAVRAIASAVEGTLGPKGLNTMLVDRFGDVTITNDGITILEKMEANHPAARLVINTAKAQEDEVGDGTTTATIMAGALVAEGFNQVVKGVPVTRIVEGIRFGIARAIEEVSSRSSPIAGLDDPALLRVATIAGREDAGIARLVVDAAKMIGREKLLEPGFKLADTVVSEEGASNEAFRGVIVDKEPLNDQMPKDLSGVTVLVLDDALEPEEVEDEALATESGFKKLLEYQQDFRQHLDKLVGLDVKLIVADRGVDDGAEDTLTDAGVTVLNRVASRDWRKVADHCGARPVKRGVLRKPAEDIRRYLGQAERVWVDQELEHVRVVGGRGKPMATILVGAATREVVEERERIARDAASAVQSAVRGGVVPGGGAVEMAALAGVRRARKEVKGMAAYGIDCVLEALRRPLAQIVQNAGFNALEKVGEVEAAQADGQHPEIAVDCDTGAVRSMLELGVIDPTVVKIHALRAAGEIAEAILRINTIIKKRDEGPEAQAQSGRGAGGAGFAAGRQGQL
jgi:chaperonin GroEL (HSP60 family)